MAFYAHHAERQVHVRISTRPYDISSWGPAHSVYSVKRRKLGNTYPSPIRLRGEGDRLWLLWRGPDWSTYFSVTRWYHRWPHPRRLIRVPGERPYVKFASNGVDTIDFAFTRAHPREGKTGIYYARYRAGAFYTAAGRRIATMSQLPLRPTQAQRVYDARGTQASAWIQDIALTPGGQPVVVYSRIPSTARQEYWYARWNGRRWENHFMAHAGPPISKGKERWYSAGMALDPADPSNVFLSRRVGRSYELEHWRTLDGGAHWSVAAVSGARGLDSYRPVVPRGQPPGREDLLWLSGHYGTFHSFRTSVRFGSPAG